MAYKQGVYAQSYPTTVYLDTGTTVCLDTGLSVSVLGRPVGAMHDQDIHWSSSRVEFQTELLAYRREDRWRIGRFRSVVGWRERRAPAVQAEAEPEPCELEIEVELSAAGTWAARS